MKRWPGKLLLVCMGIAAALLLAEGALRIAGFQRPFFYVYDDTRGWALRPGYSGLQDDEGSAFISINSDGFRDVDHSAEKPPGVFRIAFIGDSYADAYQVPVEKTFWRILQDELEDSTALAGESPEVMNFGVRGYGTAQEFLTLKEKVFKYSPDLVILAFYSENDVVENSPILNTKAGYAPFFRLENGNLVPDFSFNGKKILGIKRGALMDLYFDLRAYSRLLQVVDIDNAYRGLRDAARAKRDNKPAADYSDIVVFKEAYSPPKSDPMKQAWSVTEALIAAIRDETESHGARLLVVTLSSPIQVYPDKEYREGFRRSVGAADLLYGDYRVRDFCAANGIDALVLAPRMQEDADQEHVFFHGFPNTPPGTGHWNEKGHAEAARLISKYISTKN